MRNYNMITFYLRNYMTMKTRVIDSGMLFLKVGFVILLSMVPIKNELRSDSREVILKVPIFKINAYMMGMEEMDKEVYSDLQDNIDYLNEEFEGKIGFQFDNLHLDIDGAYLPDLYSNFYKGAGEIVNDIVAPIEQTGAINLFIFHTYCNEGTDQALMGFTPVLRSAHHKYSETSPNFDRIYIAYEGLENQSTLVHEMGHFLGLKHPWEISEYEKKSQGIVHDNEAHNHMTYGHEVDHFTRQQLEIMRRNALDYRQYLAERIVSVSFTP